MILKPHSFEPEVDFDIISCVHGLHYVGDKLGVIARACSWLKDDGVFVATFDVASITLTGGRSAKRRIPKLLRAQNVDVDIRRHRVRADGRNVVNIPWRYLGADDRGGKSFTGESAVFSFYE